MSGTVRIHSVGSSHGKQSWAKASLYEHDLDSKVRSSTTRSFEFEPHCFVAHCPIPHQVGDKITSPLLTLLPHL